MNKTFFTCLIVCVLILTGCFAAPTKEVVVPIPHSSASPAATQILGQTQTLTIATRDGKKYHVYDLSVGCFDATPCAKTTTKLFDSNESLDELIWSPNGNSLAFTAEIDKNVDVFVTQDNGKTITNITHSDESLEHHPSWSPDGKEIAYTIISEMKLPIFFSTLLAGGLNKQILPDVSQPSEFLWLSSGKIAYIVTLSNSVSYELRVINQDGSLYWVISDKNNPTFNIHRIVGSVDGKYLVYLSSLDNRGSRLYLANLENKTVEELASVNKFCNDLSGSLSPDNKWIAFRSNCDSGDIHHYELYLLNLAQRHRVKLQNVPITGNILSIAWRPNGK